MLPYKIFIRDAAEIDEQNDIFLKPFIIIRLRVILIHEWISFFRDTCICNSQVENCDEKRQYNCLINFSEVSNV